MTVPQETAQGETELAAASSAHPLKVLHIITGLQSGGAERILLHLVSHLSKAQFSCEVVSLTTEGHLGRQIRAQGIPVRALGFARGVPDLRLLPTLAAHIRRARPDLIQTWLHHADLAGGLAARLVRTAAPVVWSVHNAAIDPAKGKPQTALLTRFNAHLARFLCRKVVCVSEAVRAHCLYQGYAPDQLQVVVNGVDTDAFQPDPDARDSVRQELDLPPNTPLVGLMARFDPQKDHETFCRAAGLLRQTCPQAQFVLCGSGITPNNAQLRDWLRVAGVGASTHLLGLRDDLPRLTAALDVATCCSRYAESFALVLAEAMACGVPCVTTDMPGPVSVVGDLGYVVPIGDAAALARAWQEMLTLTPAQFNHWGERARARAVMHFSIPSMTAGYAALYRHLVGSEA